MTRPHAETARADARWIPLGLAGIAFAWCWITGSRGFFGLDQSIAMDGGWRILRGQVPFVDFWTPHGVPLMAALAGAFELLGASHRTYLGFAALEAALGAWLSYQIARHWTSRRSLAVVAGLGSAVWLQAPHGTPFSEQTAFLLTLLTWFLLLPRAGAGTLRIALAGGLLVLAMLTKQNAGALALLMSLGLLVYGARMRGVASRADGVRFLMGFVAAGLGFAIWLGLASDVAVFWRCYVEIPAGLLGQRLGQPDAIQKLFLGHGHFIVRFMTALVCVPIGWVWSREREDPGARSRAGWALLFALGIHLYHSVFTLLTHNHPENGYPFVGLSLALGTAYALRAAEGPRAARATRILCGVMILWVLLRGVDVGWSRSVHSPVLRAASYPSELPFEGWGSLRWGSPTRYGEGSIEREHLVELVSELEARPGSLFVFPEQTFLYMLLGREPPQPMLWFHEGVTYPEEGQGSARGKLRDDLRDAMDAELVRRLREKAVEVVVLERRSFLSADHHLELLPALGRLLRDDFRPARIVGPFQILERRVTPLPAGSAPHH